MEPLFRLVIILVLWIIFCVNAGPLAVDNYGLLYGSLRTFQAHACDNKELRLNCTANTIISINYVSYGREAGRRDLCPGPGTYDVATCRLSNALTVIEERCRGQMLCRILIKPDIFHSDPCPGVRKYAEVAYKCRPEEFINKIACEGERLYLNCPEGHSITAYSASFGTTISEVPECTQPAAGVHTDDCQVSNASEIFMRLCNGRQFCTLMADVDTFGDRRCVGRKHLEVKYNCVKSDLVKRPPPTVGTSEETIHTTSFPGWVRGFDHPLLNSLPKQQNENIKVSTLPSNAFKSEMQSDEVPLDGGRGEYLEGDQKLVGFMSELMSAHNYMKGNKEKLILYVSLSMGLGLLVFATVLIARYLTSHVRLRPKKSKIIPIADDQFFSDSDLEHFDPPEDLPVPPPVNNYTASLRRQSSDVQPRAPVTEGSELNHYFS